MVQKITEAVNSSFSKQCVYDFSDQSISPRFLQKALAKIEKEREQLLAKRSREAVRPVFHDKVEFHGLSFEEKKTIAKQFIRRIQIYGKDVEIMWQI